MERPVNEVYIGICVRKKGVAHNCIWQAQEKWVQLLESIIIFKSSILENS